MNKKNANREGDGERYLFILLFITVVTEEIFPSEIFISNVFLSDFYSWVVIKLCCRFVFLKKTEMKLLTAQHLQYFLMCACYHMIINHLENQLVFCIHYDLSWTCVCAATTGMFLLAAEKEKVKWDEMSSH